MLFGPAMRCVIFGADALLFIPLHHPYVAAKMLWGPLYEAGSAAVLFHIMQARCEHPWANRGTAQALATDPQASSSHPWRIVFVKVVVVRGGGGGLACR